MLCMQELFFGVGGLLEIYIFTKGKKTINVGKNGYVELTHRQVFRGRSCALCQ